MTHTTLKFTEAEVLGLLDTLEGAHRHYYNDDENAVLDRLMDRLTKALHRLEA